MEFNARGNDVNCKDRTIHKLISRFERRICCVSILALILFFAFLTLRTEVLYETLLISDTIYMLNVAWTVFQGFDPVVDFNHFYGGLLSRIIAAFFATTGVSVKAYDYALLAIFSVAAILILTTGWRRISPVGLLAATLVAIALSFTRNPLELGAPSISVAAHSMLYNRMGWLFLMAAILPAMLAVKRGSDLPGVGASAIATFLMVVSKPSFILGLAPIVIAFILSQRRGLLVWWVGCFATCGFLWWGATGVGPGEWIGQFKYISDVSARVAQGYTTPLKKLFLITASNFFDIAIIIFMLAVLAQKNFSAFRPVLISSVVFIAVTLVISVTNGGFGLEFVQVPAMAMLAIVLFETARRFGPPGAALSFAACLVVAAFAFPHMLNAVSSGIKEDRFPLLQQETEGVFASYAVEPDIAVRLPLSLDREMIAEGIAKRLEATRDVRELNDQEFFFIIVNGLQALRRIEGYSNLGIISPYRRIFAVGLQSKPVLSYPFDPIPMSPELDGLRTLGNDIDVVMVLRADDSVAELRERLLALAGEAFYLRGQTRFWDIHMRK